MKEHELDIIMPVFNEDVHIEGTIKKWLDVLHSLHISFRFHVINDGSTDDTLKKLLPFKDQVQLVNQPNRGHGPSILTGYKKYAQADWVLQVDADNEVEPENFTILWNNRETYDFLISNRRHREQSFPRKILSYGSKFLLRVLFRCEIADVNCPFRLFRLNKLKNAITLIPDHTFAPNVLITGMACKKKVRIFQVDIFQEKKSGNSWHTKKIIRNGLISFYQTFRYRLTYALKKDE